MANSPFEQNFELHKIAFKQKLGMEWNSNPSLYIQYLQTLYLSTLVNLVNTGLGGITATQREIDMKLGGIKEKLK